jgi:hypothetical protein
MAKKETLASKNWRKFLWLREMRGQPPLVAGAGRGCGGRWDGGSGAVVPRAWAAVGTDSAGPVKRLNAVGPIGQCDLLWWGLSPESSRRSLPPVLESRCPWVTSSSRPGPPGAE